MMRQDWFEHYLAGEAYATADCLAYLDRGVEAAAHREMATRCAGRLALPPATSGEPGPGEPFPDRGGLPSVREGSLEFLHEDVVAACVAIGCPAVGGGLGATWHGRAPGECREMWSATKLLPMLRTLALLREGSDLPLERVWVRDPSGQVPDRALVDVFDDIVTYPGGDEVSNAQARMLKHFDSPERLEAWARSLVGHGRMRFRGGYGAPPTLAKPLLVDRDTGDTLLVAAGVEHTGDNAMGASDLARLVAMVGWDAHLAAPARLPGIGREDVAVLARVLCADRARYLDEAFRSLGIDRTARNVVILSKMGFGESSLRHCTEAVYAAFVRYERGGRTTSLAMALLVARPSHEPDACFVVDARMAASVTEILERVEAGLLQ